MITLRAKQLAPAKYHLFVDIYENGQREKRYLKLYVSDDYTQPEMDKHGNIVFDGKGKPKAKKTKPQDKESWELATKIRTELENSVNKKTYGFDSAMKGKASFTTYFADYVEVYNRKDYRKAIACLAKFNEFNKSKDIRCNAITEDYVRLFTEYLQSKLKGETPHCYFRIFKAVMKKAYKDGLLKTNFAEDVLIKKVTAIRKDILSFEEIQKLQSTPANNKEVKTCFSFFLSYRHTLWRFDTVDLEQYKRQSGRAYAVILPEQDKQECKCKSDRGCSKPFRHPSGQYRFDFSPAIAYRCIKVIAYMGQDCQSK